MIQSARKLVAFILLVVVFSYVAKAQNGIYSCSVYNQLAARNFNGCMFFWGFWVSPDPNSPPTQVCCNPRESLRGEVCLAPRPSCGVPPGAAQRNVSLLQSGKTAQVSLLLILLRETLISRNRMLASLGWWRTCLLSRIWNSLLPARQNSYPFMFGTGWRSNLQEERLIFIMAMVT